jgi:hypothetical protein
MTAGLRHGACRRQPNRLSHRLAAIRRYRAAHLGTVKAYLLGENRLREVVALALFLKLNKVSQKGKGMKGREGILRQTPKKVPAKSLHNISYQTLHSRLNLPPAETITSIPAHRCETLRNWLKPIRAGL